MRASQRTAAIAAAAAALLLVLVLARHVIVRASLSTILSAATGYHVTFGDQRLGTSHAVFLDVHVSKNGDPVLDAQRVDVDYALRDIFPGGAHRYGFAAIAMQRPVITLTRHRDGTLTFTRRGGTGAAPPPQTRQAAAPYYFTARVRDGTIRLVDEAPLQADLAVQTIADVTVDASVKSDQRTTARVHGVWIGRRSQTAPLRRYPIDERTTIDVHRGIGLNRITAAELPLRGALGFFIHSPGIRFDDGVIDGVHVDVYALAPHAGDEMRYTVGGGMDLRGGRIFVAALAAPVRRLEGHVGIADGTMTADTLSANVAGLPLHGRGGFFDLTSSPSAWLGITGDGNISSLRALFAFAKAIPLAGPLHVETLLASKLDDPLIRNVFALPRVSYERMTIDHVDGMADVFHDAVLVHAVRARFGALSADLAGRIMIDTRRGDDILFALDASGPGSSLPYGDMLAPDATIHADALLTEVPGVKGWLARGAIDATGATDGGMTFAVNERGVGEFGPLAFTRADGSSIAGGFELQRPISQSAGWIAAHDFRLSGARAPALPGVEMPSFPPIAGVIDGTMAAGGTPDAFGVAGHMRGRDLRYEHFALGSGSVDLDGSFNDLRLAGIAVDGPLGRFRGNGAFADGLFALEGDYDGSLAALQPFFGAGVAASGGVHGPLRATFAGSSTSTGPGRIVVQTTGAAMRDARIRGIPLERVAGTLLLEGNALRIVAADASVGGGQAVIADAGGPFLVSAPAIPAAALAGAGLPLQAGRLALFGLADLTGAAPRFDGTVALAGGRAAGFPISGGADVAFDGRAATVSSGVGAFGGTYGDFGGRIAVAGGSPSYDLAAQVPLGDIGDIRRAMRLPLPTLDGSFAARVRVGGAGANPHVAGRIVAPEGSLNGLSFRDVAGTIDVAPGTLVARGATVTVGSTHATFDASVAGRAFAVDLRSDRANLADFDDYFDTAETLAGTGRLAFSLANDGRTTRTSGRFALANVRFRQFPFGEATGSWSQRASRVSAALDVFGPHGELRANGTVASATGGPIRAFTAASYDVRASGAKIDLGSWLPAFGITAPVLGTVDATAKLAGRWPRLATHVAATLQHGSLYGLPVQQGTLHAASDGARIALSDTVLDVGFARFAASGSFGLAPTDPLALAIQTQTPDLGRAIAAIDPRSRFDIAGALQADARISGTFRRPRASLGFALTGARYRTLDVPRILGSVAYDGTTLDVLDAEATFAKGSVLLTGTLPLTVRPLGLRRSAPFSVTLAASGLDLAPFAPFVPTPNTTLGGTIDGRLALEGTSDAPRVVGIASLANGSYRSDFDRAPITGANATLQFSGTSVALEALHANVGGGAVDGSGSMELPFSNAPSRGFAIGILAHDAGFALPQYASGRVNGTLRLTRSGALPLLSGDVTLSNTSVPFSAIVRDITGTRGRAAGAAPPFDLGFDLVAHAGKNVRVQGSIIDVGASGTLALGGTLQAPRLDGTLTATPGGVFSTYNHAFRIQQASVAFSPENGIDPFIDARAFAHVTNPDPDPTRNAVGSADITITVRGPASVIASGGAGGGDYGIAYSSNPPYDPEQIVGLLLDASVFGAINFGQQQNAALLRGAPSVTNPLLPPGVTPYQAGVLNFNQEAFSILNGQLVQRFLAPVERVLTGPLGLSDLELTVDYGGGVGYAAYKQLGHRDVYANFGQTLTAPGRTTLGFTARPDATTSILFNYYQQNGVPSIAATQSGTLPFNTPQRLKGISPLVSPGGFTFLITRKYP